MVAARPPTSDPARVGEFRRWLGHRRGQQLKLDAEVRTAAMEKSPTLAGINQANDVVFTWKARPRVRVPDAAWLPPSEPPHLVRRNVGRLRTGH